MTPRCYRYVGPAHILQQARRVDHCLQVASDLDLIPWTTAFLPSRRTTGSVPATFIIDPGEQLWVADRRFEHVACAGGEEVLAAGEMIFDRAGDRISASEITNQSTGYCPEASSWNVIARVLDRLGIPHPSYFTTAFEFRRCDRCGATNLIKDQVFECAICDAPLSAQWNFAGDTKAAPG